MDTRQSFLTGAIVATMGVVVGATTAVAMQKSVAYGWVNPNVAKELHDLRPAGDLTDKYDVLRGRSAAENILPDRWVRWQREMRELRGAAPSIDEEGPVPAFDLSHCEGLTRTRLTHCIVEYLENGVRYQHGQYGQY